MTDNQKQILVELYNRYKEGKNRASIMFEGMSPAEKQSCLTSLKYLDEKGLIEITAHAIGFIQFRITATGVDFVENGFNEPFVAPVIQGDNSIYVNGSNNVITDNYNKIFLEIKNSELPDEIKSLLKNFLLEIQNPKLNKTEKSNKIKQFLRDISSGTLSGLAAEGLTFLISSLLAHI